MLVGGVLCLLAFIALLTYSATDPAFSTSGSRFEAVHNKAGAIGAWVSDLGLFLFGYSVWWLLLVGVRTWLGALARLMRASHQPAVSAAPPLRWAFWIGLVLLLCASSALEWTRLYQWESHLPGGQAGGVLGQVLGSLSQRGLGFAGSGVLWIAVGVAGLAMAFRFSWWRLAERVGASDRRAVGAARRAQGARRGPAAGRARAARAREGASTMRSSSGTATSVPVVIEPPPPPPPRSERVAKEKQTPLFTELADTRLPQVDLLDAAPQQSRRDGDARDGRDDVAPDREEAEGFRRRSARRRGLAGAGDHPLRDRAGDRRQGLAGRQPGEGPGALAEPGQHPRGRDHSRQDDDGARTAERQAADDPAVGDPRLAGLQRCVVAADDGAGQGYRRQPGGRRSGEDAALPGRRHHRFGQVGRHQRDDPEPALQGRGARRAADPDRSEDARDERLRGHSASAGAGRHRHEAGRQCAQLGRRRDGAALQADEQARRAQPRRLQQEDRRGRRARRDASATRSA